MLPPLHDMALFVEVVKARGFARAAAAIGIPPSTLSRRIGQLERAIGLRLFNRTTRRVELTEAGRAYFEQCQRIVEDARRAHETLETLQASPTGVIRVSLPVDFANVYLTPLIAEFAEEFPGIEFDLDLTPRRVDLIAEPFDVAVRVGEPEDSRLIARLLMRLEPLVVAAPSYLSRRGTPMQPSDLAGHDCLVMPRNNRWRLSNGINHAEVEIGGRFKLNSNSMIRGLAVLGQGVALIPRQIVSDQLVDGSLVRLLPEWEGASIPVYAITETRLLPAKVQLFIDFLQRRLKQPAGPSPLAGRVSTSGPVH